jgi:ElaB/YqjD/DUF883 family membrane-anchored ribosome-binding protein
MRYQEALSGAAHSASSLGVDTSELTFPTTGERTASARASAGKTLDTVARYVSDNPWYGTVLVVAAGILIGLLLPRK